MKKLIRLGVPIAAIFTFTLLKSKLGVITAKSITNDSNNVASGIINNSDEVFGGLTQSTIDDLAKETYRGVRAVIEGDTIKYFYKSNSGKSISSALIRFDDMGKLVAYLGNGSYFAAKSPRLFFEKILKNIQK